MEYVTRDGVILTVGRVDRRRLDAAYIPAPVPPTRIVEAWGGIKEELPDWKNRDYQKRLHDWRVTLWRDHLRIIADALAFTLNAEQQVPLEAVRAIGLGDGTNADYLRFCVSEHDQTQIVELLLYLSTVTERGVREATARLDYTWRGKPLDNWNVGYTHGKRGSLAVDMRAAIRSGLTWGQFCELTGPEQSTLVAFWGLEDRLHWLAENNAN